MKRIVGSISVEWVTESTTFSGKKIYILPELTQLESNRKTFLGRLMLMVNRLNICSINIFRNHKDIHRDTNF